MRAKSSPRPRKGANGAAVQKPRPARPSVGPTAPHQPEAQTRPDLAAALEACRAAARRGYDIARQDHRESTRAIAKVSSSLSGCLKSLEDGRVRTPGVVEQLKEQLKHVVSELNDLQNQSQAALEERKARLDSFSVTLFGRTMAGKSTLMEILTRGTGSSIGSGAQRTTRDVRSYTWNGLQVTDVPGIAAFGGVEDEELAFQAASQADLVLFLITDDAPQPVEAHCLARVRRLGKPVLGILNVKVAIDDEDDIFLFLRDPDRPFFKPRLDELQRQFNAFADQHVPGRHVTFFPTHLRSRFLADQETLAPLREKLLWASRFDGIESRVVDQVVGRGMFLRVKSFIDGTAVPMMNVTASFLAHSAQNSSSGRVLIEKRRQLRDWAQQFRGDGQRRIDTLVSKLADGLRNEVAAFAEDHYEDSSAGEKWQGLVTASGVQRKIDKLQNDLLDDCKRALIEVARELKSELNLVANLAADRHIKGDKVFDGKRAWNWGTTILSGGLGIAALILGSGPIGWAAAAVGAVGFLVSLLFDDREKKARRAREKLASRLHTNIDQMERDLRRALGDWFHKQLLRDQVDVLLDDLGAVTSGLFSLADSQRELAWALNTRVKFLARTVLREALAQLNAPQCDELVVDVARVPGLATMLLIRPNASFPQHVREGLERLLGEQVWFVIDTNNDVSLLAQAIGKECDRRQIRVERPIRVAHVPLEDLGPTGRARVTMAQQLTGLHVMR